MSDNETSPRKSATYPRIENYFLSRNRATDSDELPWQRIPGLVKLELPRPIVVVNGAFDLLHVGHMKLIFAAREKAQGGTLICAMDSNEKVAGRKPGGRPIMSWIERASALAYMPVDHLVEITSDRDMRQLMALLKPDLRVLGIEYRDSPTRFPNIPTMFVRGSMNTSEIIRRIGA